MGEYHRFLFLVILLILVPGPDYVIVTKNAVGFGKSAGIKTVFGIAAALFCHTIFAVVGLSAFVAKSAALFTAVKYLGAIYLLYLGVRSLFSKGTQLTTTVEAEKRNSWVQGFFTNILNPKVAVFFLTFLPQFVSSDTASWRDFAFLGLTYVLLTLVIYTGYVLLLAKMKGILEKPIIQNIINKLSGFVLIIFGIKLFSENN
ncbi:LysE family translocator [uncultured Enterococcus sp.]|uniref:LysE family translocator n=1 Tax=uncultured Enterococcus sp. TaxID=167972 RepID=UPI002AA6E7F9|nr:LysE family translocator [uncultured Enterococcus sp.]